MGRHMHLVELSAFMLLLHGSVRAADLKLPALPSAPAQVLLPSAPKPLTMNAEFNGWYLRGDTGIGLSNSPGLHYDLLDNGSATRQPGSFLTQDLADQSLIGLGVGYSFTSWFRSDVTLDYRAKAQFSGLDQYVCNCNTVNSHWQGNVHSIVGMVNGYADLFSWNGFTAFTGAGIGFSYNRTSGILEYGVVYDGTSYLVEDSQYSNGAGKFNFAWALMAGMTYTINERAKLEFSYRYMDLGRAETGYEIQAPTSYAYDNLKLKSVTAHDFRVGMRWTLGRNAPMQQTYPEPPLVTKF